MTCDYGYYCYYYYWINPREVHSNTWKTVATVAAVVAAYPSAHVANC